MYLKNKEKGMMKKVMTLLMLVSASGLIEAKMVKKVEKNPTKNVGCVLSDLPNSDDIAERIAYKKKCKSKKYCCLAAKSVAVANCFTLGTTTLTPAALIDLIEAEGLGGTPIFDTGTTQILNKSGTYYLASDVNDPIDIQADSVTLNLNGNTLFVGSSAPGVTVGALTDVRIQNGFIDLGSSLILATQPGISATGSKALRITDVTIASVATGIELTSATNTVINEVICTKCTGDGLTGSGDKETNISSSFFVENAGNGIQFTSSRGFYIESSSIDKNTLNGILCTGVVNSNIRDSTTNQNIQNGFFFKTGCSKIVIRSCSSNGNTIKGLRVGDDSSETISSDYFAVQDSAFLGNMAGGIRLEGNSTYNGLTDSQFNNCFISGGTSGINSDGVIILFVENIVFRECTSNNSTVGSGFIVAQGSNIQFYDCIANNNFGYGFNFVGPSTITGLCKGCNARNNTTGQFFASSSANQLFYSNVATNLNPYTGLVAAMNPATTTVTTGYWTNVRG